MGIISGIKVIKMLMISLFVNKFLKRWKFNDKGFVKFFKMLIGNKKVIGLI